MIFKCCMTQRVDATGNVNARGAAWREPRLFMEEGMCKLGEWCWYAGATVAFFGCIFGALLRVDVIAERGLVFGALLFVGGFALIWYGARFPAHRRELLFYRDGFIRAPHRLENGWVPDKDEGHHLILNIEAVLKKGLKPDSKTDYTHGVRLLMEHGKTVRIANNLDEDQARRVVTALVESLNTIRSEIEVEVGDFVDIT